MERQMEGQKDGQTLFHRMLHAEAGGPKTFDLYKSRLKITRLLLIRFLYFYDSYAKILYCCLLLDN